MRGSLRRIGLLAGFSALAAACFVLARGTRPEVPPGPVPADGKRALAAWGRVLETHVDGAGRVDFAGLSADRGDLEAFLRWVARADEGRMDAPELLAFHINAYNALAMYGVVRAGVPRNLSGLLAKVRFFVLPRYEVAGRRISLYRFENAVIRKEADARVHAALNCMSESCPRLPREPFEGANLDGQLGREARLFFNDGRNVRVDHAAKTVRLSGILRFYAGDFLAEAPSLRGYANDHRDEEIPEGYKVEFLPYDWTVVERPTPDAS